MHNSPRRVLHVIENLDRGAAENWLIRMLKHARRSGIDVDWSFYCALGQPGARDRETRALDSRVIYSPVPIARKKDFVWALRTELWESQYDVLHCHHDLISAVYLLASARVP